MRRLKTLLLAAASMFLLGGCVYNNGIPPKLDTITKVTLNEETTEFKYGAAGKNFTATVEGENDYNKSVRIETTNPQVATTSVSSTVSGTPFTVTPSGLGECQIKVISVGDSSKFATLSVSVIQGEPVISVTGITLAKETLEMTVGDEGVLLDFEITPMNATNQGVDWESSNIDVATVSDTGVVTAVSEGEAVIKVTTKDGGFTDTCAVTVSINKELKVGSYYIVGDFCNWVADARYLMTPNEGLYSNEQIGKFKAEKDSLFKVARFDGLDGSTQMLTWCEPDYNFGYDDLFRKDGDGNYSGELVSDGYGGNNIRINSVNEKKAFTLYFVTEPTNYRPGEPATALYKYYLDFNLN